jgi:hypothetical protein
MMFKLFYPTRFILHNLLILFVSSIFFNSLTVAQKTSADIFKQKFDLGIKKTNEIKYYKMETKVISYSPEGKRVKEDNYILYIKYEPDIKSEANDKYICNRFLLKKSESKQEVITELTGWSYKFEPNSTGSDSLHPVFGIDHKKFENLKDSKGKILSPEITYMIYNNFIDFHSFNNVFAEKTTEGKGIQDLKHIGDKIIHDAAFTAPPVNLGSSIEKGSYFKNGEITLELKGLSVIDNTVCAIVAFDSGESSFKMIVQPMPNMKVNTVGSSHYFGDIYIDLNSNCVKKVSMKELVVSETIIPNPPIKQNAVIERTLKIESLNQTLFEDLLSK